MDVIHPRVAGIDVHKKVAWVAVRLPGEAPGERKVITKRFKTFWRPLQKMAAWLAELGVTDAAMESTGVIRGRQQASATAGDRPAFVRFPIRRGRVICRTVCDADSRLWRSSGSHLSSLPILPPRRGRVCHDTTCAMSNFWLLNPG